LSKPPEALRSPYVKSEFFSYLVAAETVSTDLVNFLVDSMLQELRQEIQGWEDDAVDLIQAEYKEHIIPGKIIAERFDEIDGLLEEMNRFCTVIDKTYTGDQARRVLHYAFEISITADTKMDPTIKALREMQFEFLHEDDRAALLDKVEEHLGVIRFERAKDQTIAMEKAVAMRAEQELKSSDKKN